jgi:hypothetical protein
MSLLSKINTKRAFGLTRTVDFVALPPQTQPKSHRTGWRLKDHWSQEIWPPSSKDCNP